MIANKTIVLLESFVSGRIDISEFKRQISDRLFELRQKPTMNDEKRLLSKVQLYLHEADEGSRERIEVYMASQAALDLAKPFNTPIESQLDVVSSPPQPGDISVGSDSRPRDITYDKVSALAS